MALDFLAIASNGAFPTVAITNKSNRALLAVSQGLYKYPAPSFSVSPSMTFKKQKINKAFVKHEIKKIFTKQKITKTFVR